MKRIYIPLLSLILIFTLAGCSSDPAKPAPPESINSGDGSATYLNLDPIAPNARSLGSDSGMWYKDAVFYHLWIAAFNDSGDSGTEGDIPGITAKLDYLQNDLGVTAIWLSPFWDSASSIANRHNYDAKDHYKVHPAFGTNTDLENLITQVHSRGMKIIFDWVPNHISNQHPWFIDSATSRSSSKRSWFIWSNPAPAGWNGWDSNSDFYPSGDSFYYGIFWSGMPDLNYGNQEVRDATGNVIIHWLNAGFDGMRVDAVKYLYEDWSTNGSGNAEQPLTFAHFQEIRSQILDKYSLETDGNGKNLYKFMVAENWEGNRANLLKYMSDGGKAGFNMTLDFPFCFAAASLDVTAIDSHWYWIKNTVEPAGGWTGTFTSNHDNAVSRPMTSFNGDESKVRAQAALQLTGVGTPIIYYGNELGMTGAAGNDINLRQPINWTNVDSQKSDAASFLNWHKALITLRKNRAGLRTGSYTMIQNSGGVFAYERTSGAERSLVVINLTANPASYTVNIASTGTISTLFGTNDNTATTTTVTLNNMTPRAVRVIALNDGTQSTLISDISYTPPPPVVTLRGTFTGWDPGTVMSSSAGVYSLTVTLSAGVKQFKFHNDSGWIGYGQTTYNAALGSADTFVTTASVPDGNITFTATTAGDYKFYFRPSDGHYSIDQL